jgi:hypothetical protein
MPVPITSIQFCFINTRCLFHVRFLCCLSTENNAVDLNEQSRPERKRTSSFSASCNMCFLNAMFSTATRIHKRGRNWNVTDRRIIFPAPILLFWLSYFHIQPSIESSTLPSTVRDSLMLH